MNFDFLFGLRNDSALIQAPHIKQRQINKIYAFIMNINEIL